MPLATPIVIGNWKMNGLRADGLARARALRDREAAGLRCRHARRLPAGDPARADRGGARRQRILLGGQDCSSEAKGAHTGDLSAAMLADAGCRLVIVGHSERRHGHGETDALVRAKATAAQAAGLLPILCIGETEAEWSEGRTLEVLDGQLEGSLPEAASAANLIVAYEPVWAIGTGRTPSREDIAKTHGHLRARLAALVKGGKELGLLYGGSVKAGNAKDILAIADVDGALVGGASLDADEFLAIYSAGQSAGV